VRGGFTLKLVLGFVLVAGAFALAGWLLHPWVSPLELACKQVRPGMSFKEANSILSRVGGPGAYRGRTDQGPWYVWEEPRGAVVLDVSGCDGRVIVATWHPTPPQGTVLDRLRSQLGW
jgi:hypothetical protein